MPWAPDYQDRTQNWEWPYNGLWNLGPVTIPPRLPFTGLVDRATGQTWFVGQNGASVVLSLVQPVGVNVKIYQPFDGPFLPYGNRLGASNGVLVMDNPNPPLGNSSAPVWIYNVSNPQGQTFPEPTNIPALLPVPVPGVPSSSPAPTGGGFGAFNSQMPRGSTPPFLTVILTTGMVENLAWWNGTAWVDPNGSLIEKTIRITWDPNNKDATITLSNANLTATSSANAWKSVISTGSGKTSGKWYYRIKFVLNATTDFVGAAFCSNTEPTNALLGNDANGWLAYSNAAGGNGSVWHNAGNIGNFPPIQSSGDYIVVAYDANNGGFYATTMTAAGVLNTNWNNTNANPSTGTGGMAVPIGMALQPGASFFNSSDQGIFDTTTVINDPTLSGFKTYDGPFTKIIGGSP